MATHAVITQPAQPDWNSLAKFLRRTCQMSVTTPKRVFECKMIRRYSGQLVPHGFCPVSARCNHISLYLSGITRLKSGQNAPLTIYLTSHISTEPTGVICFGHINIPKDEWLRNGRKYHVRLYTKAHGHTDMLQQEAAYHAVMKKVQIQGGPNDGETKWMSFDDAAHPQFTHTLPTLQRCTVSFVRKFEKLMNDHFL